METDLYNLPKDMLVELVSKIREQTNRENKEKYERMMNEIIDNKEEIQKYLCEKCAVFIIVRNEIYFTSVLYKSKDWITVEDFTKCCDFCGGYYCKNHLNKRKDCEKYIEEAKNLFFEKFSSLRN